MLTFRIVGPIDGTTRTVFWTEGEGFTGATALDVYGRLIEPGEVLSFTPTGPFYPAGDKPLAVAYLTALSMFDPYSKQTRVEGTPETLEAIEEMIAAETWVPEGATP